MRVVIDNNGFTMTKIWIVDDNADRDFPAVASVENGRLEFRLVPAGEEAPPTLRMDSRLTVALFASLAEALSDRGIRTDDDAKLLGTLEATRAHLTDLRELLKLPRATV